MGDSGKMAELLGRLRVEMNGAVTDAMKERGIYYPLNYGVSVPTIKKIAVEYRPDHKFAKLLWRQEVRELKLAALYIADPAAVKVGELAFWGGGVTNTELAEHAAAVLFSKTPLVGTILNEWLAPENSLLLYSALMTGAGDLAQGGREPDWDWEKIMDKLSDREVLSSDRNYVWAGTAAFLSRLVQRVPASRQRVEELLETARSAGLPSAGYLADELGWMPD